MGSNNVAAITNSAQIETENNALQIIPALIMAGELIVLAGTVYSANEVVDSLLEVSEGNKTFTELAKELTEEAVIDLVLDKATKGAWKIAKKTKSGKWIDSQADIFQEKGKEWLAKKGYSPNKIKFLERKFDDINDVREDTREEIIDLHGKDNVKSTTAPPLSMSNVRLAGKEKVIQVQVERDVWDDKKNDFIKKKVFEDVRIVFDKKGYPIFDDHTKVEIRLPIQEYRKLGYVDQMKMATIDLGEKIKSGEIPKNQFNFEQLKQIENGEKKIKGYTWHHHQDTGRMQLVPDDIHKKVGHVGWDSMNEGQ
ncbi:unnamed protein product [Diamesa hyperborea]